MYFLALLALAAAGSRGSDVIVVGAGCGGLATGYEASRAGADVTVVDLASVFGGHAVVSEGGLSFPGTPLQATPFVPGRHAIDREAQIAACAYCHLPRPAE